MPLSAEFPEKLQPLFTPHRYKVLYGGRGAGRSWGAARALLLLGTKRPIRVLCARELQKSISESVHKLLGDQIVALGLEAFYEVQQSRIIGVNGTSFAFEGIKNNVTAIKSYEGIDYCWVEEANKVSRASWGVLIPTIRKEGSEIWITFNPELETDYTYQRFVLSPSSDSFVQKMTWVDNPWFPDVLRAEKDDLRQRDMDAYLNIWEGHCLQVLEGVVFAKELRKAQEDGRVCSVPWDPETPVDTFWDLGKRDHTSIWFAQKVAMQIRVLGFYEDTGLDILPYIKYCQSQPYIYGTFNIPHDGAKKVLGQKRSIEQVMRGHGLKVRVVPRINHKVNAINAARLIFGNCWFDEDGCADGLARLRRYRYKVVDGQYGQDPLHDENSDAADAYMTMAQARLDGEKPKSGLAGMVERTRERARELAPGLSWMGQ